MAGRLIVFEGLDGAGITTQATLLRNFFLSKDKEAILTKEPSDGLIGGIIKSCLRHEWKTNPLTLQMLFAADRAHHLVTEIEPAIKKGKMVICDRYVLSSLTFGSLNTSIVHPREVFSPAIRDSTAALIFLHNHPSGDPAPSQEDRDCTQRLCRAGKILGIRVLDHIVLGHEDYFSFADVGMLTDA